MKRMTFKLVFLAWAACCAGAALAESSFTVGVWVRLPSAHDDWMTRRPYSYCSRGFLKTGYEFSLGTMAGVPEFKYMTTNGVWHGVLATRKDAHKVLEVDRWFHFVGVHEPGRTALYVDGQLYAEQRDKTKPPALDLPVVFSGRRVTRSMKIERVPGEITRFFEARRVLTPDEIAVIEASQRPTLPKKTAFASRIIPSLDTPLPEVEAWAREKAQTARWCERSNCVVRVVKICGVPRIEVDGRVINGTAMLPDIKLKPNEVAKSVREFAAAGVGVFSDIWYTADAGNDWWLGEGVYDFDAFDRRFGGLLKGAPCGYVFPRIKLDPPAWWAKAHPDEMIGGCVRPTSKPWRDLFVRMLRDVIPHAERAPYAAHVIGYQFGAMIGSEWLSPLREKPAAQIPLTFRERADGPADSALLAARVIKALTHRNKLTGVFFGYDGHYFPEHARLMDIVRSPDIDFIASPAGYTCRREGESGRFNTNFQATYRLHNKIYWEEADLMTHFAKDRRLAWHAANEFETVGQMKRAVGWALTSGHELWWFLLFGNYSFHDATLMRTVRELAALAESRPAAPRNAEVAVFHPAYRPWYGGRLSGSVIYDFIKDDLPTCGVPVDSYELEDLANPNLPAYKAYVVLQDADTSLPEPFHKGVKTLYVRSNAEKPDCDALRKFLSEAGAHAWCTSGDVFAAGCGFGMIHAVDDGDKTVTLPTEFGGGVWRSHMRRGETAIFRLTDIR